MGSSKGNAKENSFNQDRAEKRSNKTEKDDEKLGEYVDYEDIKD